MEIQDLLIAAVQNIQILIKQTETRVANAAKVAAEYPNTSYNRTNSPLLSWFSLIFTWINKKIGESCFVFAFSYQTTSFLVQSTEIQFWATTRVGLTPFTFISQRSLFKAEVKTD